MNKVVVYASRYGTSKQYAHEIGKKKIYLFIQVKIFLITCLILKK
ncbi:hypothetical protein [Marinilactibacillus psychrotolerans]